MRISRCAIYEILLFHLFLVFYALSFPLKDDWGATALLLLLVCILLFLEYQRTRLFVSPLFSGLPSGWGQSCWEECI